MTDFNPLNFIADHAGMNLADAVNEAYEQGKRDAQPESAIPLSWIEAKIEWLKSLDNEFALMAAGTISALVNSWKKEGESQ